MAKAPLRMLNSKEIKPVALAVVKKALVNW